MNEINNFRVSIAPFGFIDLHQVSLRKFSSDLKVGKITAGKFKWNFSF